MKRIFDPVHRFIELDAGEVRLINLPVLQRLRRLRQLGLAYLAYPSAEHSRFTHALGALAVGEAVFASLRRRSPEYFADEHDFEAQRRLVRAALLLHDVGHGPFSHACEAVLGIDHEARTRAIFALPDVREALGDLGLDPAIVLGLIEHEGASPYPVLRELVSGPNLDADRMDYLRRDAYFTGVVSGTYDAEQLIGSLRVFEVDGAPLLGVDGRGVVALESFVLARYMMFATVYFHHTTRAFERVLQSVLRELWPDPRALDPIETFLDWDDFRVFEAIRDARSRDAVALRERKPRYSLAAEFNAERDLRAYEACARELVDRFGDAVWADSQEQLIHRLPLSGTDGSTVYVRTASGVVDAREASDVIRRLAGTAYWRKLFVSKDAVDSATARAVCREVTAGVRA